MSFAASTTDDGSAALGMPTAVIPVAPEAATAAGCSREGADGDDDDEAAAAEEEDVEEDRVAAGRRVGAADGKTIGDGGDMDQR